MKREPPKPSGPLLSSDDEHPGHFADGKWEGPLEWCSRHGPAIVQWSVGLPTYVWNASAQRSARVSLWSRHPSSDLFRVDADGPVVSGRIAIAAEDVAFEIAESCPLEIKSDLLPFFNLLRSNSAFVADLAKNAFAGALYSVIEKAAFVDTNGALFEFGQRSAAHFVAALRDSGEDYLDFAWGRGPEFAPADADRVREHFARLGVSRRVTP